MENQKRYYEDELPKEAVFALDIGTRSIIGMVGIPNEDKMQIVAIERAEHTERAMIDGQIENVDLVAKVASTVKQKLEQDLGCRLTRVAVAVAGRALKTKSAMFEMELPEIQRVTAEMVSRLEAGAINEAEKMFSDETEMEQSRRFYLVGYSVSRYYLDDYMISSLIDHHGRVLKAEIIATFLPSEVVESLYATVGKVGLEVASLTLEPIAAINAAIPPNIRLLNLAMVDIGAGTSDIAVCRDGGVTGYTMAIQAGDEITEAVMKAYLVDFGMAERMKAELENQDEIVFTDIMGFEQTATRDEILGSIEEASIGLCKEICDKIVEVNGGVPSALFMAGGGSKLLGLKEKITDYLHIDPKRVALAGRNFSINAYSEEYDIETPEFATPIGIVVSAGLNMINDSYLLVLNGQPAKLFRSGIFTVMDILMMNGYGYQDMMGKSGQNLVVRLNGERKVFYGEKAEPCVLKLNGKDAQLSNLVQAGDKIDFVPARHGESASAMLSQLVELEGGREITVNGEPVATDVELKFGDVILVEGMYDASEAGDGAGTEDTAAQAREGGVRTGEEPAVKKRKRSSTASAGRKKKPAGPEPSEGEGGQPSAAPAVRRRRTRTAAAGGKGQKEATAEFGEELGLPADETERPKRRSAKTRVKKPEENEVRGDQGIEAAILETAVPGKPVQETTAPGNVFSGTRVKEPEPPEDVISGTAAQEPALQRNDFPPTAVQETARAEASAENLPASAAGGRMLWLYFNDEKMVLPPKADGSPYYLMDMLQYSGIDFEKITAPVMLEVNGEDGAFQQELRDGDRVRIYERPLGR